MFNHFYQNPLETRYKDEEMLRIFSNQFKIETWRKLWIALAEGQRELGLNITKEQIEELKKNKDKIDFAKASKYEQEHKHEVMAHVYAFGDVAPKAKGILHLGATSAYVLDNTDVIQTRHALQIIKKHLLKVISNLADFAQKYQSTPTLAFTHFQAAQLTTVGKRACMWIESLRLDLHFLDYINNNLFLRGLKGTTGTAGSFKDLFDGDYQKYQELENKIIRKMGFNTVAPITGQTYDRKQDLMVAELLANIAQSLHKITNDIRLLGHLKEIEEPFGKKQIGSSAMAYKKNPIKSENISSLAKYSMALLNANLSVASTQWLERTLDDSANKRISYPQSFLAVTSILKSMAEITGGFVVYEKVIEKNIKAELPFMATEKIIMEMVKQGKNRQEVHEKIRTLAMEATKNVKELGLENNLIELIKKDDFFETLHGTINGILEAKNFIGFAPKQVDEYLKTYIKPLI